MIEQIIVGAVGGFAYSLSGLVNKEKRESFDWKKMVPTIVVAGVIGAIAGATRQDYGMIANGTMAAGATVIIEKVWKAIYRKIIKK